MKNEQKRQIVEDLYKKNENRAAQFFDQWIVNPVDGGEGLLQRAGRCGLL